MGDSMIIWFNGFEVGLEFVDSRKYNFIVVTGKIGIGKSVYCRNMSMLDRSHFYLEIQDYKRITSDRRVREKIERIIEIKEVIK